MGKHEMNAAMPAAQPAAAPEKKVKTPRQPSGRRRKVLPLVLIAVCTALLLTAVHFLRAPDVGFADQKDPADTAADTQTQPDTTKKPTDTSAAKTVKDQFFTFLLAGTNDSYNTDTLLLCSIDAKNLKVNMISIPRDSMVDRDTKIPKINGAYGRAGVDELMAEVTEVTGVPINYYCVINVDSFVKIIDLIGGVEYNVPIRMYHPDAQSQYTIDIRKGQQTLNGKKAAQFCRFRSTSENDFGRMNRQKDFLLASLRQVRDKFEISQIEDFIKIFNESVKTNMSGRDMVWFYLNVLSKLNLDSDVAAYTLPYTHAGYYKKQDYVYLDAAGIVELVNKTVNPYTTPITESDLHIICLED